MVEKLIENLADLPEFLAYFVVSLFMMVVFVAVYTAITRHNEIELIKENSVAATRDDIAAVDADTQAY